MKTTKDTRLSYSHERIEHEGNVWNIDAKLDAATGRLVVYRVYGDITNDAGLKEAIDAFVNAEMLRLETRRPAPAA